MSVLLISLMCLVFVGACISGGMIFSGFILMQDDPPLSRPRSLPWFLFWLDLILNDGLGFQMRSLMRNWRVREYARRTILRGLVAGIVILALGWISFRMLLAFGTDA